MDTESELNERLTQRTKLLRGYLGLTQEEMADELGIDRSALAKIEVGARRLSLPEALALARAARLTVEELAGVTPLTLVYNLDGTTPGRPRRAFWEVLREHGISVSEPERIVGHYYSKSSDGTAEIGIEIDVRRPESEDGAL